MNAVSGPPTVRARRTFGALPLHRQVYLGIESLALATPLDDTSPVPTEAQLSEQFGVSRGTVRKATRELVRRGLLRSEIGRGTFVDKRTQARMIIWSRLVQVARPDSRFHLEIAQFVPDFEDSDRCHEAVLALDVYKEANTLFVAPDNSVGVLRKAALDDGKTVLVPTYGMRRGIVLLDPSKIAASDRRFAATLDGMEELGETLALDALMHSVKPIDLLLTGATAVTLTGAHVGGGQAYLDLEWAILAELDLVGPSTPTVCLVHDCQVIDGDVTPGPFDVTIDVVVTPSGVHTTRCSWPRPTGITWDRLDEELLDELAYLAELQRRKSPRPFLAKESV